MPSADTIQNLCSRLSCSGQKEPLAGNSVSKRKRKKILTLETMKYILQFYHMKEKRKKIVWKKENLFLVFFYISIYPV